MNQIFDELSNWVENKITKLKGKAKGQQIESEFQLHEWNISCLLIEEFLRTISIPQIKNLNLKKLQPERTSFAEELSLENIVLNGKKLDNDTMDKFLQPISDSFILFDISIQKFQQSNLEFSEQLKDFLLSNGFLSISQDPTLIDNFKETLKLKIQDFQRQFKSDQLNNLYPFKRVTEELIFIIISFANIKDDTGKHMYNISDLRKFGLETNIYTNEGLVESLKLSPEQIHDLLDMQLILDKFEDGTINSQYKKYIKIEDYIDRYLKYCADGDEQKEKMYASNISIKPTIEALKSETISFETFFETLKNLSKSSSKRETIKNELKKLYIVSKNRKDEEAILSPKNLLKLAEIKLVSGENLMKILEAQEELKKVNPSIDIYSEEYSNLFITENEARDFFSAARLLKYYFNTKNTNFNYIMSFYKNFIISETADYQTQISFQEDLLNNLKITPKAIVDFFSVGVISINKFRELIDVDSEVKKEFYTFLPTLNLKDVFEIFNYGIINEDDLIENFGDSYEEKLREALINGYIWITKLDQVEYLDHNIIMEVYQNSIQSHSNMLEQNNEQKYFDFMELSVIYLANENLVTLDDIIRIISEEKDPTFQRENFDVSECMYNHIVWLNNCSKKDASPINFTFKIRELYLNGLLSFNELAKLTEEGIISSEDAQAINNELCSKELLENLRGINLGGSIENQSTSSHTNTPKHHKNGKTFKDYLEKLPNKNSLVSQQTEVMLEILKQYGFEPLSTEPNAYGFSEIQTFSSGNFENYMVLLSEEIPEVAILMHSKHVKNTDIYYQTGGNATYILSTAKLKEYLEHLGVIESKFSHLNMTKKGLKTDDPYLRTANVTKNWGINIARKTYEVLHMLEQPELEEHSNSIAKSKTNSFNPEIILPKNLSDKTREERLEAITMFNNELVELKEQIENDENHGY